MACIGNDVVAWKDQSNAKKSGDFRYLTKILTAAEINAVHDAKKPDLLLWSLWASKETAYKVMRKTRAQTPFLPRRWPVDLHKQSKKFGAGAVTIPDGNRVFIRINYGADYIHCIGADDFSALDRIVCGIAPPLPAGGQNAGLSSWGRKSLLCRLAGIHRLDLPDLEIRRIKNGSELGSPCLYYKNVKIPFDISLSHDGNFAAYAFLRPAA